MATVLRGKTDSLDKYIDNMKKEFINSGVTAFDTYSNDLRLTYLYAFYHYFNADSSSVVDIISGTTYDGKSSDGIAAIYHDTEADLANIDVIVPFFLEPSSDFNYKDIPEILHKAEEAIYLAKNSKFGCRRAVSKIMGKPEYSISVQSPLVVKILTNWEPTPALKKRIQMMVECIAPEHNKVSYSIVFGSEVEYEILEIEEPREYVSDGIITIDKPENVLSYGDETSVIVNVSAESIKQLYIDYGYRGLFAQNLRYYVKNAKIDDKVIDSMQSHPENFWYFNNGIIIICDGYSFVANRMRLKNFSIINGGQTTKLIGETEFDENFFIQCKIIVNRYEDLNRKIQFISDVAEASNTQKPIKDKDLIANRIEQRELKQQLAQAGIYCQIKRGEKINKKLYPDPWQNTSNEEIGQFIYSFVYQKPGAARNNKNAICGNPARYDLIFGSTYSSDLLSDFLKIKTFYKLWITDVKQTTDRNIDGYKIGLANNGLFFTTAIIGLLAKLHYHKDRADMIRALISEEQIKYMNLHDINHHIFKLRLIDRGLFFAMFDILYERILKPAYMECQMEKASLSYSNFTKTDSNYVTRVLTHTYMAFRNGILNEPVFQDIIYEASEDELEVDRMMFVQHKAEMGNLSRKLTLTQKKRLQLTLNSYRRRIAIENNISDAEVLSIRTRNSICENQPRTMEELSYIDGIQEAQIQEYGDDILRIVNNFLLNL